METSEFISTYSQPIPKVATWCVRLRSLVLILIAPPIAYFVISYCYLVWWHKRFYLLDTLIHENGRLTLIGSMFYFDHFIACVPMILLFALVTAGGFALAGHPNVDFKRSQASIASGILLGLSILIISVAFIASIYTVGEQRTLDYALQRIERDGIMSKGGNWNQLQLSNVPIALGAISLSGTLIMFAGGGVARQNTSLKRAGKICIAVTALLMICLSAWVFPGWDGFLNPRWMAHSIRELATYPITGIPVALCSMLIAEWYISGLNTWIMKINLYSIILIVVGLVMVAGQLIWLANVDVLAIAQKPSFAPDGLSLSYLLTAHVFEHFLDFVLIAPLTAGIYLFLRVLSSRHTSTPDLKVV